ncbi:MAG: hypothetical protein KatS3mg095_0278 [Candidatus Parcubacteria bacterium]|nr:MAG: hypothetical protein KatS3mg095_0278 [Candidatus Parcubacteria bacterium]
MKKIIFVIYFFILICSFYFVFADIIIGDFFDNNYFDQMVEMGNISNIEDGGNENSFIILETYPENFEEVQLINNLFQLEESNGEELVNLNEYNNDPVFNDLPLDVQDNEEKLPFGGLNNDPNLELIEEPQ